MSIPLMPKATAVWLVENTTLTFKQIADFCGFHELEVKGIADGEVAIGIVGLDPVANGQLTKEEIARCEADPTTRLQIRKPALDLSARRSKGPRYTPVARRQDKPDAIAWLLRNTPELSDTQIVKLIGTTKHTINAVRDRTHWNSSNIKAQHPVGLSLCGQRDLDEAIAKAREKEERRKKKEAREAAKKAAKKAADTPNPEPTPNPPGSEPTPELEPDSGEANSAEEITASTPETATTETSELP